MQRKQICEESVSAVVLGVDISGMRICCSMNAPKSEAHTATSHLKIGKWYRLFIGPSTSVANQSSGLLYYYMNHLCMHT